MMSSTSTVVSAGQQKYLTRVFNTPSKIAPQFADSVIVFGPSGERELVRRGVSRQSIHTLPPSGNIEERFTPLDNKGAVKEKLDLPTDETVALYVGRIESLKGIDSVPHKARQLTPSET